MAQLISQWIIYVMKQTFATVKQVKAHKEEDQQELS